jgi:restriction system protein
MRANLGLGQVWRFAREIQKGDLVALPLKSQSAIAFGRITGDYQYKEVSPNVKHIRSAQWVKTVPRSEIPKDLLDAINASLTVFNVHRNNAEERLAGILSLPPVGERTTASQVVQAEIEEEAEGVDLEQTARDEIIKFIQSNFKGHELARLVDAVLRAQGYKTQVSPPGPDGGVDILAGSGSLGFDQPCLCVQVKSGAGAVTQGTFNEFHGVVSKFASQKGLFVSWSGFTSPVKHDAKKDFFKIRLWDQGDIVEAVLDNYERLDDEMKADLPLKRIWTLVKSDPE